MTKQAAMTKLRSISRPRRTAFALEPRMLFDGAAAVAVDQFQPEAPAEHDVADATASSFATPEAAAPASSGSSRVLILVDERLAGNPALMAALPGDAMVRVIAAGADGLDVATEALREAAEGGSVDAVHLLSHGSAGQLSLGRDAIDTSRLTQNADQLASWSHYLGDDADILLYGCDIGAGERGTTLLQQMAMLTGADLAASTNATGNAARGGDWQLELSTGSIEARSLVAAYDGLLAAPTITDTVTPPRTTQEDVALAITGITMADSDNPASVSAQFAVTGGTLSLAGSGWTVTAGADGSSAVTITGTIAQINAAMNGMSFTPAAQQNGTIAGYLPRIDITVRDLTNNDGPTTLAVTNIVVSPVNDAPVVAGGVPLVVNEGGSAGFAAALVSGSGFTQAQLGLTEHDNSPVQTIIKITGLPSQGTLRFNGNPIAIGSTLSVADIAQLSYQHDGSQVTSAGTDSFVIAIDDGAGGLLTNQIVNVTLQPVNQAPVVGGSIRVIEGETGVRLDDNGLLPTIGGSRGAISIVDPEGEAISSLSITSLPTHGKLFYDGTEITAASVGSPFIVSDRTKLTYSHDGGDSTADSFNIRVSDAGGGTGTAATTDATVNLSIYPNDDDPVLTNNVQQTMADGTSSLIITNAMLQVTDTDSPPSTLTYTLTSVPAPALGYFTLNGLTLTAGASFTQADIDAGHVRYITRSTTARTDAISFTVKDGGQRILPDLRDGGIYDTPAQNSPLTVNTFRIVVPATVTADPAALPGNAPVNVAPSAGGTKTASVLESETVVLTSAMLDATDPDNIPAERVYRLHSLPTSGNVTLNGSALLVNQTFTQQDVIDGKVRFAHAGGEDFIDAFNYTVSDGQLVSPQQTFSLNITPQNDTPTATTSGQFVVEGGSFALTTSHIVLADADNSASDNETGYAVNQALSFRITGNVAHGTLKLDGVLVVPGVTVVTAADLAAGKLVYQHDNTENYSDSFKLVPLDDAGVTVATATNQLSAGAEVTMPITIYPLNDAPAYHSKSQLIAGQAGAIKEGETVTIGGASSYAILNGITGSGVPTPPGSGAYLIFGDNDNSSVQRQYRVSAAPANGQILLNGAALAVGSVFTQDDLDAGRIQYRHNGSETSTDQFQYVVSDGDYTVNDSTVFAQGVTPVPSTFLIEITPRNDVPTLTVPTRVDAFANGAGTTAITGITIADPDLANGVSTGETDFVRVEIQVLDSANAPVAAGLLNYTAADPTVGAAFISGKGSNALTVQGTKAQVDAVLASLNIGFSSDADADNYKIRVTVDDRLYDSAGVLTSGANGGQATKNADGTDIDATNNRVTRDIQLRASNSNDVPVVTGPAPLTVNEDATLTLSGFTISDADSFGNDVTVTVRLYSDAARTTLANTSTQGSLQLGATTGLTSSSGNNTNTITLVGSVAEVQAAINALKYAGVANFNGTGSGDGAMYLKVDVADFNHADGQRTGTVNTDIVIKPVNDQPTLTVPGNQTLSSGTSISITSGFAVGDAVDIAQGAADYVEVTVAATRSDIAYGTLSVTAGSATVDSNGTATIVVKGTTAAVQTALNTLVYTPTDPNVDSTVLITATVDDKENGKEATGVGGNNTRTASFNINVSGTNDAPVLSAPATLTVSEDSISNAIAGLSIADPDDFGSPMQVTLDLGPSPKGTITLTTLTGLTFTTGDGTADGKMVFTGTETAINTALATLKFTPTANLNTLAGNEQTLVVTVNDQANTGVGGAKSDSKNVVISITPVNDAPLRTAASVTLASVPEDTGNPAGAAVNSIFGPIFNDATDTQSGGSTANALAGIAVVANAATASQGKWQYDSGSGWTDLPTAPTLAAPFLLKSTDQVRFLPNANWNGTPGQLTVRLIDDSSGAVTTGAGPDLSGAATGGTTAYSNAANAVALGTSITAVNDAPLASGSATLAAINEDTANPAGALVSALITASQYSDVTDTVSGGSTATALGGLAIVGNTANATTEGRWQYSTNGTTWVDAPTSASDSSALILPTTASIRFVPVANYSGTPGGLSVRLADSVQTLSAASDISGVLGGTNTWSTAAIPLGTTVNPINDAPVITALSGAPVTVEQQVTPVRLDGDGNVTVFDRELSGSNWNSANLTVRRSGAAAASDVFSMIDDSGTAGDGSGVEISGGNLLVDGVNIGSVTNAGGTLSVNFNASATDALVGKAMGAVAYRNTSDTPPGTVQINFDLNDRNSNTTGGGTSGGGQNQGGGGQLTARASVNVAITQVNDTPTIAFLDAIRTGNYVENGAAVQIDNNVVLTDPELDTTNWNGATLTVSRSGGGNTDDVFGATGSLVLTPGGAVQLAGVTVGTYTQSGGVLSIAFNANTTASRADQVVQGLTYRNASDDPPASVTLTYTVNDQNPNVAGGGVAGTGVNQGTGGRLTVTANTTINITRSNDAPALSVAPPAVGYTEQAAPVLVDAGLTLSDADDSQMASATVSIGAGGFVAGDTLAVNTAGTGITATYNPATGVLTLSGNDSVANYQQVLRSLSFSSSSDDPTANTTRTGRTLTIALTDANSDGAGAATTSTTRNVTLTPVNDTPVISGAGSARSYTENGAAVTLEPGLALSDLDDTQMDQAIVRIQGGFVAGDRLNFVNQSGITGSYDAATGVLTLTGAATLAQYQAALQSVTFDSTSENPGDGARTLQWTVRDVNSDAAANGKQVSLAGTTTVNVTPVNDPPVAQNDSNSLGKAATTPVTGTVLSNDSDVDADPLSVTGLTGGAVGVPLVRSTGTLTVNADGTYSFSVNPADPAVAALGAGQTLTETYTYTVSDGHGGTASATLTITINGANNAPVANADANLIDEGTASISANAASGTLLNDTDLNSDPLTVIALGAGAGQPLAGLTPVSGGGAAVSGVYGQLQLLPDGSYTYTLNNSDPAVNALATGETLSDRFTYAISDGKGGTATANVVITIRGQNDPPDAIDDAASVPANGPAVSGRALSNDRDPDSSDTLTVSAVNGAGGNVGASVVGTYGSIQVAVDGSYTYTPNSTTAKALGAGQTATDTFTYTISDGHGGTDTATITITLSGANDVPVARADTNTLTEDQGSAIGNVLTGSKTTGGGVTTANPGSADSDPDTGDTLLVSGVVNPGGVSAAPGTPLAGSFGSLTLNPDGSYSYALSTADPVVQALRPGETRNEVFTYTISDGKGGTATATLTIEVVGANDPPVAVNDQFDTVDTAGFPGGTPISGNLMVNDSDPDAGATLAVTAVSGSGVGTVGGNTSGTFGTLQLNADGSFTYDVDQTNPVVLSLLTGDSRTDTFTYTISDGLGGTSTATVTFTIHGTNDAPAAHNDSNAIAEDQVSASGNVISGLRVTGSGASSTVAASADADPDGDPLTVSDIRRADPAIPAGAIGAGYGGDFGSLTINADGSYTYALDNTLPAVQALKSGETISDVFIYTVNDGRGQFVDATLTIVITGTNDAPLVQPDTNTIVEDSPSPVTGSVLLNDRDPDNGAVLTITGVSSGSAGSAPVGQVASGVPGSFGTLTLNANGSYSYQLDNANPAVQALAAGATATDTFTYAVTDDQGVTRFTTLTITIIGTNDAPIAVPDVATISAGTGSVTGDLTPGGGTQDRDVDGDPIQVTGFANASGVLGSVGSGATLGAGLPGSFGSLQVAGDGSHRYSLDNANPAVLALKAGETINETFTYTISDGQGGYATSTLTITITGRNDPPVAVNDGVLVTNEDTALNNINVLGNDSDLDGDPLTVTAASSAQGTVTINPDGTLNFVPNANFNGPATISYTISDGQGGTATATVSINVVAVNDPPVATDDTGRSPDGGAVTLRPLVNDSDPDGDALTVSAIGGQAVTVGATVPVTGGVVRLNADGSLTFTPNPGVQGLVSFQYTISDGKGGTSTATIRVDVTPAGEVFVVDPPRPLPIVVSPLSIDQAREPSVFFDGDTFNGVRRLPIPFHPAVFVNGVVQAAQLERQQTDPLSFSDPEAVRLPEMRSTSIGVGLGFDPALFVQHAVRNAQRESAFLDDVVDGRLSRINLSSDWRIPTPDLAQPNQRMLAVLDKPASDDRFVTVAGQPVTSFAEFPSSAKLAESSGLTPRASPSFSEQLRQSNRPLVAADRSRVVQKNRV